MLNSTIWFFKGTWAPNCDFTLHLSLLIKCSYLQDQVKYIKITRHPTKNCITWKKLKSYSVVLVLHEQIGSKGKARVMSDIFLLLFYPHHPHLPLLCPSVVIFLWALSHHASSAFHSPTIPVHTRTAIITFKLIPFL